MSSNPSLYVVLLLLGIKEHIIEGLFRGYIPLLPTNPHSVASKDSSFNKCLR